MEYKTLVLYQIRNEYPNLQYNSIKLYTIQKKEKKKGLGFKKNKITYIINEFGIQNITPTIHR